MSKSGRRVSDKPFTWSARKVLLPIMSAILVLPIASSQVRADSRPSPKPSPHSSAEAAAVATYLSDRLNKTSASRARKMGAITKQISVVRHSLKNVRVDAKRLLKIAAKYKGVPYRSGGTTPKGFDCSGYTQFVYRQIGIELPRVAQDQLDWSNRISAKDARPGDLAFYLTGNYAYHAAIYAGNGMIWHSPHPGTSVVKVKIRNHKMAYGRIPASAITPGLQIELKRLEKQLGILAKSPGR
ncbi:MAG: NlpC/P60 family protein [Actinobacteria bacterium]|nr:NlpC/P60 family protein [Actinomycetota bacterium]NBY15574.1 NlpC/P60 family protein [Actinomycetota bacterium]